MIDIQNLTKSYGKKTAVKNLTLSIEKGEVFGFLGPNGAGKTTTMKMILGLARASKGSITILGEPAESVRVKKLIGYLPEQPYLYKHLNPLEFLTFVAEIFGIARDQRQKRVKQVLRMVNFAPDAYRRPIKDMSKGMQQRIAMAQALVNDPRILFLDEPMSGLDPIGRREMKELLLNLKNQGKTIFLNSHVLADAQEICDRVAIIHHGQLLLDDKVQNLVDKNKTLEDVFLETIAGAQKKAPTKKTSTASAAKKAEKVKKPSLKKAPAKKTSPKKPAAKKKIDKKTSVMPAVKKAQTTKKAPTKK